jgi:CTP:phosphocholine cytidylyltransferase-like protein
LLEKIINNYNIVVVNSEPKHRIKSYLKDKYPNTLFVKKICDRTLGGGDKQNKTTYFYTLALDRVPQHEWKNKIKELNYVENQLKQNFIYELDIRKF